MTANWDNKTKPPIRFIISAGVHFLIFYREKVGWEYFRVGADPKPELLTASGPDVKEKPTEAVYDPARKTDRDASEIAVAPVDSSRMTYRPNLCVWPVAGGTPDDVRATQQV